MSSFVEDFKYAWNKPQNGMVRLIILNVIVFIALNLVWLFSRFAGNMAVFQWLLDTLSVPPRFLDFLLAPWSLFTYFFTHQDFFHILINMLIFYWFGLIFTEFLGSRKLVALYILGGLAGAVAYLLMFNLIPYFISHRGAGMIGASASVYAIVVGAATLMPDYRINLLFFGPVRIKYIAAVYVFLSLIGTGGSNAGGNIAHLGGALMGFLFIGQMRAGNDWSIPVLRALDWLEALFTPRRSNMKVTYRRPEPQQAGSPRRKATMHDGTPEEEVINRILDKISEQGYEKLTSEEKQILYKASQKQ